MFKLEILKLEMFKSEILKLEMVGWEMFGLNGSCRPPYTILTLDQGTPFNYSPKIQ